MSGYPTQYPYETRSVQIPIFGLDVRVSIEYPFFPPTFPPIPTYPNPPALEESILFHRDVLNEKIKRIEEEHRNYTKAEINARLTKTPNTTPVTTHTIKTKIVLRQIHNVDPNRYSSTYEIWNGTYDLARIKEMKPLLNPALTVFIAVGVFKHITEDTDQTEAHQLYRNYYATEGIW